MTSPSPSREVEEILNRLYRTGGYKLDGTSVANGYIEPLSLEEATQSINQLISNQISATLDLVEGALPIRPLVDEYYPADPTNPDDMESQGQIIGFNDCRQQALEAIKKIREMNDRKRHN